MTTLPAVSRDTAIGYIEKSKAELERLDAIRSKLPATVKVFGLRAVSRPDVRTIVCNMSDVEVKTKLATDLNFFAHFMLGDTFKFEFPPLLVMVWQVLVQSVAALQDYVGIANLVLGIPRGFAKTTLIKLYVVYCLIFTRHTFIVNVGNIEKNSSNLLKDVSDVLDSDIVRLYFGDYDADMVVNQSDFKYFKFYGQKCILRSKGALTSMRGINVDNRRPNIIIMDDVQDEENAKSDIESAKLYDWIFNTLLRTRSPDGSINIYVGNTYPHKGTIITKLAEDPEWISLILGAILEDGSSLWEELHPIQLLLSDYNAAVRAGNEAGWLAEFMNVMDTARNDRFDKVAMQNNYDSLDPFTLSLINVPYNPTVDGKFIVIDPASTKKNADEHAVALVYIVGSKIIVRDVVHKRLTPKEAIRIAVSLAIREGAWTVFIEDVAYQDTLIYWFNEELKTNQLWTHLQSTFKLLPINPRNRSKNSRILQLFKQINVGDIVIHPTAQVAVANEGIAYIATKSDNEDNVLDACHYALVAATLHRADIIATYERGYNSATASTIYKDSGIPL